MQKFTVTVPTGNKIISKRVAITITMVFISGALLWTGATRMNNLSVVMTPSAARVSVDEPTPYQRTVHNDQFGMGDQLVTTHMDSATASRKAAAFQEFKKEISMSTKDLDNSDARIDGIVDRLTSLKICLSLTYLMAKDFFTGSSAVDGIFLAEATEMDHLASLSVSKATQAIDRLHSALKVIEDSYTESYIVGPERTMMATDSLDEAAGSIPANDLGQLTLTRTIAFKSSLGSTSALLSATALAKTANSSVWRLFGAVGKKTANRMAIAAFPAIADGLLPIGDVVTLALESGCLAWSFHEVYEAQGAMKNDLHRELSGVMKQNSNQIHEWAMNVGNELMVAAALPIPASKVKPATRTHSRK